jgi:hypothetical protein
VGYRSLAALAKPVALHGQTAEVTIDVSGFAPTLGPGSRGDKYERLAQLQRLAFSPRPITSAK